MRFKHFLSLRRKYVSLYLTEDSREKMELWCRMNGFDVSTNYRGEPIDKFKFHVTVFYSSNQVECENGRFEFEPFPIEFSDFDLFGENLDVPVLLVKKTFELRKIRRKFEEMGMEESREEWNPHLSLSYKYEGNVDFSKLVLPRFRVEIDKLIIEDIDEGI